MKPKQEQRAKALQAKRLRQPQSSLQRSSLLWRSKLRKTRQERRQRLRL
jgi:hypothetical protein